MSTSHWVRLDQVQGNVTPGFRKDYQAFLLLRFPQAAFGAPLGSTPEAALARGWLGELQPCIASAETVATFNRLYRLVRARTRDARVGEAGARRFVRSTWVNVAFTAMGKTLDLSAGQMLHLASGEAHALRGEEDSSLLLTLVLKQQS